jgi:Protein of unknown function (DUF3179)
LSAKSRTPALVILAAGALVGALFLTDRPRAEPTAPPEIKGPRLPVPDYGAVRTPATVPAAAADLKPTEPIIGVVFRGRARAYRLNALIGLPPRHVVNDLLGGGPLTVTACDLGQCIKVFTADGSEPLDVHVGGYQEGLALNLNGQLFSQSTGLSLDPERPGEIPLTPVKFEGMTWEKWRAAHPDTDVYVGEPNPGTASAGRPAQPPASGAGGPGK